MGSNGSARGRGVGFGGSNVCVLDLENLRFGVWGLVQVWGTIRLSWERQYLLPTLAMINEITAIAGFERQNCNWQENLGDNFQHCHRLTRRG